MKASLDDAGEDGSWILSDKAIGSPSFSGVSSKGISGEVSNAHSLPEKNSKD